ncbi:MAG: hypothetical protein B6U88_02175 [Candidatus Aenigmarchaeota archaeon ex4484_56]|nr:MAG: hypothetical protein B6U88_02175 [Candidatus Aenigmarchaeota archaeon ex4484_56]
MVCKLYNLSINNLCHEFLKSNEVTEIKIPEPIITSSSKRFYFNLEQFKAYYLMNYSTVRLVDLIKKRLEELYIKIKGLCNSRYDSILTDKIEKEDQELEKIL